MLKSMTAFARQDLSFEGGVLTWELRSVNHRYLEPNFRLPEQFREAETVLRETLRKKLSRGKIDCTLKWQPSDAASTGLSVNVDALRELNNALSIVSAHIPVSTDPDKLSLLQWPGVLEHHDLDRKELLSNATESFKQAVAILCENRMREGAQLAPLFESRLQEINTIVAQVREKMPAILEAQHANLVKRLNDAQIDADPQRLEQELVVLAQKSDVAEELDRLDAHVKEVTAVLKKNEPVGRRLDFLMQELNREANTLSSKSIVTDTTKAAVELKVLIEQMREQVQNIE